MKSIYHKPIAIGLLSLSLAAGGPAATSIPADSAHHHTSMLKLPADLYPIPLPCIEPDFRPVPKPLPRPVPGLPPHVFPPPDFVPEPQPLPWPNPDRFPGLRPLRERQIYLVRHSRQS